MGGAMNAYDDAEARRRRACSVHYGSVGPYCYRCSEREFMLRAKEAFKPFILPPTTDDAAGEE